MSFGDEHTRRLYERADILARNPDVQWSAREAGMNIEEVALDLAASHEHAGLEMPEDRQDRWRECPRSPECPGTLVQLAFNSVYNAECAYCGAQTNVEWEVIDDA